ncbi:uncharacterized protein LOC113870243 [Abrus precatorius]|uniref:Uncharacterized protein LOC113870243 n=1 Tax=Abrus precatorius TaxID=3816 RepID=A0A8B8M4I3_ABRPR|nr:uncharacterized protein LOC113870243 [Abrus precatorius]
MEAYSSSYPTSNSSYLSQNPGETKGIKNAYPLQSHSLLHSVRKSQSKPWKRAPVAPPLPTPIKVYKVDAINFRDLVQHLTAAPEFKPQLHHQLLQSVASTATSTMSTNWYEGAQSEALGMESQETTGGLLELNLSSTSSYNWCSVPRMNQETMTNWEPGRVLEF